MHDVSNLPHNVYIFIYKSVYWKNVELLTGLHNHLFQSDYEYFKTVNYDIHKPFASTVSYW